MDQDDIIIIDKLKERSRRQNRRIKELERVINTMNEKLNDLVKDYDEGNRYFDKETDIQFDHEQTIQDEETKYRRGYRYQYESESESD